uniref:Uncharacterized protein n=1 Tax=Plectus sambesii TaxID=2011161 RepID=A0A914UY97_9BILA
MCPSLASLDTPTPPPYGISPQPYSVQPDVGCTSVGCTNTVTCACVPAGDCALTLGNNLDTPSPDTSPFMDTATNVPVTSTTITCTPSGTYSVAAGPAGTGGPFTQISCNA